MGEGDKPVCWWSLEGSDNYRVIYGDLRMVDVAADELPKPTCPGVSVAE